MAPGAVDIWQVSGIEALRGSFDRPLPRMLYEDLLIGLLESGAVAATYRKARHELRRNTLILCQPGEVISFAPERNAAPVRFCARIPWEQLLAIAEERYGRTTGTPTIPRLSTRDPRLIGLFRGFGRALTEPASLLERTSRVHELLVWVVAAHARPSRGERPLRVERPVVRRARTFLDDNAAVNISLAELARLGNVSAYYLNRVFRAEVGMPPHEYQTQVRIDRGKHLLAKGLPVHRVAAELGFYDQGHFTRQFGRLLGYPPSAYRDRKIVQG